MPQTISSDIIRVCKICGQEFHPHARKQYCCGEVRVKKCAWCGKEFEYICKPDFNKATCSIECQAQYIKAKRMKSASATTKICKWCGKEFHPKSARDVYCEGPHYQTCEVCGKQFEVKDVSRVDVTKTCSDECRYKLMVSKQDKDAIRKHLKETMQERYGVDNAMQLPGVIDKMKQTNLEKYGTEWYRQTDEYKEKVKQTSLEKYGVAHYLQSQEVINKRIETVKQKYGANNVFASDYGKRKVREIMMQKYGVINPSQYKQFKKAATRSARSSKLEQRISQLLVNYHITFERSHFIKKGEYSHEFDFYIPKYKLLIDADGLYYHGYLDDPDGERVREDYDEVRLHLVPEDHIFHVLVETQEDRQLKELIEVLESVAGSLTTYNSILFDWCRSIDFPYPEYSETRLLSDWKHLCSYKKDKYIPQCRIGISLVKEFHRSIYQCHVGNNVSPYEGWYNDDTLKKVIRNRFIYKNDVDPSKILSGFNISKTCPTVSIFNPILARYLTLKYLNEFDLVYDPFSGFSGRLLGVASTNKRYIGRDLNERAVTESNQIIDFLELPRNRYRVDKQDIFDSTGSFQCLLTCPPYDKKEIYNSEEVFKTCDEWIDECLRRFKCKRYVFVVDGTVKYAQYAREEIKSDSHFAHTVEQVIVIDA